MARMNSFGRWTLCVLLAVALNGCQSKRVASTATRPPNIVLIFCDDLAYGDIGPFGSKTPTPNLDRLAREGMRFTDFYVPQAVCSASRAALLTGCYPNRVGIQGALPPRAKVGLNPNEVTIAELLKGRGYATAIYGKWHLGDAPQFLPTRQGFDEWFGLPYSNDMWPHHPTGKTNYPPLPLFENERVTQLMPDQTQLTTWYTEHSVKFIERKKSQPFFLYLAHNMPHVPIHVSDKFKGKSGRGLYRDVIMEIDWSVGEVLKALKRNGLDENTLVIFTSDNGPWLLYGDHAGNAGPLREGKATSWDGGVREPTLMRWPGKIPAGATCSELATTMDMLPTIAKLAGTSAPTDRVIDGRDISPLMFGEARAKSPHEAFFIYWGQELQAVRSGKWKLHLPHNYSKPTPPGSGGKPGKYSTPRIELALFDLSSDIGETKDVAAENPEVVARLQKLAEKCAADLGDSRMKTKGTGVREPGRIAQQSAQR
jgi:arylsulfatase A